MSKSLLTHCAWSYWKTLFESVINLRYNFLKKKICLPFVDRDPGAVLGMTLFVVVRHLGIFPGATLGFTLFSVPHWDFFDFQYHTGISSIPSIVLFSVCCSFTTIFLQPLFLIFDRDPKVVPGFYCLFFSFLFVHFVFFFLFRICLFI